VSRVIAMYLPQFHPIPENDAWHGIGFTEWTNVTRVRPLFRGHYQPHLPADLGFYDLRLPETRRAQAALARQYGISAFCYYHYWFSGKVLLERPLQEVLASGEPDFPFLVCWANGSWTRTWNIHDNGVLLEQRYSAEDDREHIRWLMPYLRDPRYVTVRGRPVVIVYRAGLLPDPRETAAIWNEEAKRAGLPGLYLMRFESNFKGETGDPTEFGFDAAAEFQPYIDLAGKPDPQWAGPLRRFTGAFGRHHIRDYRVLVKNSLARKSASYKRYPCVTPSWDNSARRAAHSARIWRHSTPDVYREWLQETLRRFVPFGQDEDFVIINAWNEWAEGNHLEPDLKWGRAYLEATQAAIAGAR
jgi:lipopolysaccharide biosynthesis protein